MQAIRRWTYEGDAPHGEARVTFEGGAVLSWDRDTGALALRATGDDDISAAALSFMDAWGARFDGSPAHLRDALERAFPSRLFPAPIPGYDLLIERAKGASATYVFTGGATVTYDEDTGRISCDDRSKSDGNPLKRAVDAAFPPGVSVLTRAEMSAVLRRLTEFMPATSVAPPVRHASNERPLRPDAPYRDWYSHDTVRAGIRAGDKGQEEVLDLWWETVRDGTQRVPHLLVHAPTGLGKTSAALAPALAWQQRAPGRRQIYYLVMTVNQHDNPVDELRRVVAARRARGHRAGLRVVDLAGQDQVTAPGSTFCCAPHARPADEVCAASRRAQDWGPLLGLPLSWRDIAARFADADDDVCPYHYLQGLMATADVVICDYWWVFDPAAPSVWDRTSRFGSKEVALIVDEAHNLIPRVRGSRDVRMRRDELGHRLEKTDNAAARDALRPLLSLLFDDGALAASAERTGLSPSQVRAFLDVSLLATARDYWDARDATTDEQGGGMTPEERLIRNLLVPAHDDGNIVIYTVSERPSSLHPIAPEPTLHVHRVDATEDLARGYGMVRASLTVSGTLIAPNDPEDELRKLVPQFGLPRDAGVLKADSPFPLGNQQWVYSSLPSGRYHDRELFYPYYRYEIVESGRATPGVTAVFFSSYEFMQAVYDGLPATEQALVVRETRSGDADAEATGLEAYDRLLRERLSAHGGPGARAYLFAVYSGKLAQGANFAGNVIKTVICVSVPAEMVELFHERLCRHLWPLLSPGEPSPEAPLDDRDPAHKAAWGAAWHYAYERPSMYQVLQATGRGIRGPNDRCAFVLLDRRYDEFKWHDVLAPEPFHADEPHVHVRNFHAGGPDRFLAVTGRWDALLPTLGTL